MEILMILKAYYIKTMKINRILCKSIEKAKKSLNSMFFSLKNIENH